MANEELAARIQAGERELMAELWRHVERLVAWQARRVMAALDGRGGVEFGDLYDAGYLALLQAVETYQPGASAFSTWLMYHLRNVFAQTAGYRTKRQRRDPLQNYVSLYAPLGDEDGDTLEDLQPDPRSAEPFETVEGTLYQAQLREVLDAMLDELPEQQREVLRKRYFEACPRETLGQAFGVTVQRVAQIEDNALHNLREPPLRSKLEIFLDQRTPFYLHVTATEFQRTQTSAVEKIILLRERWRNLITERNDTDEGTGMAKPVSGA